MNAQDFSHLQGATVLVKFARDHHNPPTALRGSIEVDSVINGVTPPVKLVVEVPEMFARAAHQRIVPLDQAHLAQLVASEKNGAYEITLPDETA